MSNTKKRWHRGPVPPLHTDHLKRLLHDYITQSKKPNTAKFDFGIHYNHALVTAKIRFDELAKLADFIIQLLKASPSARIRKKTFQTALTETFLERRKTDFHRDSTPRAKFVALVAKQVLRVFLMSCRICRGVAVCRDLTAVYGARDKMLNLRSNLFLDP